MLFARESNQGTKAWCLIILSIFLMVADHHYHHLSKIRGYLSQVVYPLHWAIDVPSRIKQFADNYFHSYKSLQQENQSLKHEHYLLMAKMQTFMALEAENARLRALLKSPALLNQTPLVAEIIQANTDPFIHRVVLNKGAIQGVILGQPVIDANGIVGEVIEVYPSTCRVILLSDASYGIPVENVRTGLRGIIAGTGNMKILQWQHVANTTDLQVGDTLVTNGLDGRYPPGYPVGVIKEIAYDPSEAFAKVLVQPSAHLDRNRLVLLIKPQTEVKS